MSTSYQFAREHNLQTVLWAVGGGLYATYKALRNALAYLVTSGTLWAVLHVLSVTLGLTALIVGAVVLVAMIQPIVWLGLAIVSLFAVVTYPRMAVK